MLSYQVLTEFFGSGDIQYFTNLAACVKVTEATIRE